MSANAESWKRVPFGEVQEIPYRSRFTAPEYEKLKLGLIPRAMEDKWFIYYEEPFLAFHRSWTGQPVYKIKLVEVDDGAAVEETQCATEVITKSNARYQAMLLDFVVSNLLLGQRKPFPVPPEKMSEKLPGVYQHAMVGRGYRQTVVATKPWWKFWR